ncbi:MAG: VOC family protein [Rhodobiaceae bacterium]|nr:VOC family protein [Rhodobiaceae bacterium]
MTDHGHFHWNELMTRDVAAAKAFYADTIGWTYSDMPMPNGTYTVINDGDAFVGGMFDITSPEFAESPTGWFAYIAVDDVDARLAKAKAAGASVIREPFDVPDVGRIAILVQPDGAAIGWITPANP